MNPISHLGEASSKKQFTLVELLVVVAIITVLAGLLLPALKNAFAMVRGVECQNRLKQIGLATGMYHDDWNGTLVYNPQLVASPWTALPLSPYQRLYPYFGSTFGVRTGTAPFNVDNLAMCPALVSWPATGGVLPDVARISVWHMYTYAPNALLNWSFRGNPPSTDRGWHAGRMVRSHEIRTPSREVYWQEGRHNSVPVGWFDNCGGGPCMYNPGHNDTWPTLHYDNHIQMWRKKEYHFLSNGVSWPNGEMWYGGSWFNLPGVNSPVYSTFSLYLFANTK